MISSTKLIQGMDDEEREKERKKGLRLRQKITSLHCSV